MTSVDGEESRLRGFRRLWPVPLWVLALLFFVSSYDELGSIWIFAPGVAALATLIALPLVLVPRWPLLAWWLVFVLAVVSLRYFPRSYDFPLPWPPEVAITAVIVLFAVGLRHRRDVLFAVGALSVLVVVWGLVPTASRHYHGDPTLPVVFVILLLVLGHLAGDPGRAQQQVAEGERGLTEVQTGRAVLEERPRMLGLLRDQPGGPELAAQPGLGQLRRLVASARRLRHLLPAVLPAALWVLAIVLFFSVINRMDKGPVVAALIALPLVLVPRWPLLAWWLVSVIAVVGVWFLPYAAETSLPWPPEVAVPAVIVLFSVGLRHRRHVIFAVGGLSILAVVLGLLLTTTRNFGGEPAAPVAFVVMLLALGYLTGARSPAPVTGRSGSVTPGGGPDPAGGPGGERAEFAPQPGLANR